MVYTKGMKADVINGKWLGDEHMSLSLTILQSQFPSLHFQSPLLSHGFQRIQKSALCIQIHNIDNNHWVTSHSVKGEVYVYDSSPFKKKISTDLAHQLASIYGLLATEENDTS